MCLVTAHPVPLPDIPLFFTIGLFGAGLKTIFTLSHCTIRSAYRIKGGPQFKFTAFRTALLFKGH